MFRMVSRRKFSSLSGAAALGLLTSCGGGGASIGGEADKLSDADVDDAITVTSTAFAPGEPIPEQFSCDGEDVSPELTWDGVPDDAASLALVFDDPDAGGGTFVHWVVYGLDPSLTGLEEGVLPDGARQAANDKDFSDYMGPCPPAEDGAHTYRYTVYALDEAIDADDGAGQADVLGDVRESAVAKGTLTATFDH